MSYKILMTNAIWSAIAQLLNRGSLILASILLARGLDTPGFAAYSYFQLTVSMLAAYGALGLGITASRFFAESAAVAERPEPPLGMLWMLSVLGGLIVVVVVMCLPANWFDGGLGIPQWLLALGIFFMILGVVPAGGILGLERYAEATIVTGVSGIVMVFGAMVAGNTGSAIGAIWAFIIVNIIQAIGNTLVVLRHVSLKRLMCHSFLKTDLRKVAGFAGPMTIVSLFAASGMWIVGRLILDSPSGKYEFALFTIGLQWFSLITFLPAMVSRVVLPKLVRMRLEHSSSLQDSKILVQKGIQIVIISALVMCCFGMLFTPWLRELYGSNYEIDTWLIVAFMIAAIPSAPSNMLGNAIVAHDGQWAWLGIMIIWFFCLLLCAKEFLTYGALSAALAQGFASLLMFILAFVWARKRGFV